MSDYTYDPNKVNFDLPIETSTIKGSAERINNNINALLRDKFDFGEELPETSTTEKSLNDYYLYFNTSDYKLYQRNNNVWASKIDFFNPTLVKSSWSETTTDTNVASEKLTKDSLDAKLDDSQLVTSWSTTTTDTNIPSEKLTKTYIDTEITDVKTGSGGISSKQDKLGGEGKDGQVVIAKETLGDVDYRPIDTTPFIDSQNLITSGGVKTQLDLKFDTAGTGLSKNGTTLNHSNSVTAETTGKLGLTKYDAQGHITGIDERPLVTSWSGTTADTNIASEKLVKDSLDTKSNIDGTYSTLTAGLITKCDTIIDLSDTITYSSNKWYPVLGTTIPNTWTYHSIDLDVNLNTNIPTWSSNENGFVVNLHLLSKKWNNEATSGSTIILDDEYKYTTDNIRPASFTQLKTTSQPLFYLRGEGKYHIYTDYNCNWEIITTSKTVGAETISPLSTEPSNNIETPLIFVKTVAYYTDDTSPDTFYMIKQ